MKGVWKKLNLKDNKKSYYINISEWNDFIEDEIEGAIRDASVEVVNGIYSPFQLSEMVAKEEVINKGLELLQFTYNYSVKELPVIIDNYLIELPGGEDWKLGKR